MKLGNKQVVALVKVALLVSVMAAAVVIMMHIDSISRSKQTQAQEGFPDPRIDYIHLNGSLTNSVTISRGHSVTIGVRVTNVGTGTGYLTGVSASFPELDSYNDPDFVDLVNLWTSNGDDDLMYIEWRPGSDQLWYECGPTGYPSVTQELLVAGYAPSGWEPGEEIDLEIKVTPPAPGTYQVYVKVAVADTTGGDSYHHDPDDGEYIDQQCQYVYRQTIEVRTYPNALYLPVLLKNRWSLEPLRAVWMQPAACSSASTCDQRLDCVQAAGATRLYYLVCYGGQAYYHSDLMPHLSFDSLAYVVPEAHARGMKVFATLPVGYLGWPQHPEWNARYNHPNVTSNWLDFTIPAARDFVADMAEELVTNYDVDGVSLDFMRWHEDWYIEAGLSAEDVSLTVQGIYGRMKGVRPAALLTATPNGDYNHSLTVRGQDWHAWLDGGYIDYVDPMCYGSATWISNRLGEFQETDHFPQRIAPLLCAANVNPERQKPADQLLEEIQMCRDAGAVGLGVWDDRWLCQNQPMVDALGAGGW